MSTNALHHFANGVLVRLTNKKTNIWRVDADGSNPKRLTSGVTDVGGICSADGEWVYYYNLDSFQTLRVPIDGGNPEEVPGTGGLFGSTGLGLSSDGKLLAFFTPSKDPRLTVGKLALVPLKCRAQAAGHIPRSRLAFCEVLKIHARRKRAGLCHPRKGR